MTAYGFPHFFVLQMVSPYWMTLTNLWPTAGCDFFSWAQRKDLSISAISRCFNSHFHRISDAWNWGYPGYPLVWFTDFLVTSEFKSDQWCMISIRIPVWLWNTRRIDGLCLVFGNIPSCGSVPIFLHEVPVQKFPRTSLHQATTTTMNFNDTTGRSWPSWQNLVTNLDVGARR